jgi:antagonist of KipI
VSIRVLRPGLLSTVQDRGRHGHHRMGLVPGGAMDGMAAALANALVGNAPDEAVLEITIIGPELVFEQPALVALSGAEFEGDFPHHRPVLLAAGARLPIGRARRGARAYLGVAGGIDVAPVLDSRATYLPGRFGGYHGRALQRGDVLPLAPEVSALSKKRFQALKSTDGRSVSWYTPPTTLPEHEPLVLHALEGHHYGSFDAASQRAFFDATWKIAPESNRMGFRLVGPVLTRANPEEILSGPTGLGSVQVPASGTPIVLMADHQTTGGYPRIAEVASADVPRLAQLAPGATVRFARCTLETAIELRLDSKNRLDSAIRSISWKYAK